MTRQQVNKIKHIVGNDVFCEIRVVALRAKNRTAAFDHLQSTNQLRSATEGWL
jgi:hypothetical protein